MLQISLPSKAQFSSNHELAYKKILSLHTKDAADLLAQEDTNHSVTLYLKSYLITLQLLAYQDDSVYQQHKNQEEIILEKIKKTNKKSPYYRFLQAEVKIQWALVKFIMGDNFAGAWSIKQAYHLLCENKALYPHFMPNNKSLGFLHLILGSVPEKYQWLLQLFGLEGNIQQGEQEMQAVIQDDNLFVLETQLLLVLGKTYILHQPDKALEIISIKESTLSLAWLVQTLASMKAVKPLVLLPQTNNPAPQLYSPLFDYLKGEIALLSGNYMQASIFYQSFLKSFKGKNYIKSAYYRLFLIEWLLDKLSAFTYLDKCLKYGQAQIEADKNAEEIAKKREIPHKILVQARLFTDGGYYDKAWDIINQLSEKEVNTPKDRIEFFYRKARILDKQGKSKQAEVFYQETILRAGNMPYYFAPNSALHLGYLYRDVFKDKNLAKIYFKKVLSYTHHEYKSSLDHKAKTALKTI
jgi:hypothetical protein